MPLEWFDSEWFNNYGFWHKMNHSKGIVENEPLWFDSLSFGSKIEPKPKLNHYRGAPRHLDSGAISLSLPALVTIGSGLRTHIKLLSHDMKQFVISFDQEKPIDPHGDSKNCHTWGKSFSSAFALASFCSRGSGTSPSATRGRRRISSSSLRVPQVLNH